MTFIASYGLFLLKTITLVIAILIVVAGLIAIIAKARGKKVGHLTLKKLNEKYQQLQHDLQAQILSKKEFKAFNKAEKKSLKEEAKTTQARIFVLHFDGDIRASAVIDLREEITALLTIVKPEDEVVVCLESGGGMVHSYGLASSQLQRLREQNIPLTVIVDKVAASGGYMMACVATKIIAAPFAIIGSIGVLAQLPNFNRWLKKRDIDFEQLTAGEFKRTLTMFGENTPAGREKMQEELETTHVLFKEFIKQHRPQVDLSKIATGEHWFGTEAEKLLLVDKLQTSDDYLLQASKTHAVFELKHQSKKSLAQRLGKGIQSTAQTLFAN